MNRLRHIHRLTAPWLRGAVSVYLVGVVCVAALHQHHDPTRGHDCALCTVAHAPAVVPHAAATPGPDRSYDSAPVLRAEEAPVVTPRRAPASRAPPLI